MLVCPLCRLVLGDTESSCPRDGRAGVDARPMPVPDGLRARFEIVEAYAQGDSGDLFLVDDTQTSRRGLLKLLRLREDMTPAERARLKRELVKQATLTHPALRVPLATGDTDGRLWLFREWQEGVSLSVHLGRTGALTPAEALTIASELAGALDALHRAGLLHRDIEPGHIIVEPQPSGLPRVSLIDAGIASRVDSGTVFDVLGTPEYLSPEQASGKLVSFRSDLYALGCVLFEMLTGAPPYQGEPAALIEAHAKEPAPTPPSDLPTGVGTLLTQLLSKAPRERPFSAQQVKRALAPFLPEDGESGRQPTQTFEKMPAATAKRKKRVSPSGTLRPPSSMAKPGSLPPPPNRPSGRPSAPPPPPPGRRATSVPPPPPGGAGPSPDRTEELGALDLEQAEEVLAAEQAPARRPRKPRVKKTLLGVAPPKTSSKTPDATQPLSALDLEQAEEILAPKVAAAAEPATEAAAGLFPELQSAPPAEPDPAEESAEPEADETPSADPAPTSGSAMLPDLGAPLVPASAPPSEPPPASEATHVTPPWEANELRLTDPPQEPKTTPATASSPDPEPAVEAAAEPEPADEDGLDYDDLAETVAYDREKADAAAAAAAEEDKTPIARAKSSRTAKPKKSSSVLPMLILGVVGGLCIVSGVGGAGMLWFATKADESTEVASMSYPSDPYATTARETPVAPLPPPVVPNPPIAAVEPVVEQPVVEEPVVEAPVVEAPVVEEPVVVEPVVEAPVVTAQPQTEEPAAGRRGRRGSATEANTNPPSEPSGPTRLERFNAAREEALGHYRARRFPQAARAYQQATRLNARHAGSFAGLGACYLAMREPQQAVRAYQRAVTLQPRHAGFNAALGQAYHAAGDRTHAREAYRRALAIDANNQAARQGLARVGG